MSARPPLRHYCTLFDRNYLLKGLALYQSLERHGGDFVLHILAMDDMAYELLGRMKLPRARLIRREEFEDPELLAVKPTRSVAEYCWTCTPSVPLYVLARNPDVDIITHLDADLMFFSSPEPIFEEIGAGSIAMIEHRFSPRFVEYEVNGKYNVQWITFRRDANGLECARWWRERCLEWCFYRVEEGRMGDQKYLDVWPEKFRGVHVIQHLGAGVGPWNFANYRIAKRDGAVFIDDAPLIFYHYHAFRLVSETHFVPLAAMYLEDAPYPAAIYEPYEAAIAEALALARRHEPGFAFGIESPDLHRASGSVAANAHWAYWVAPEWFRATVRRLFPAPVRAKVTKAIGARRPGAEKGR